MKGGFTINISEIRSALSISDALIVGYDDGGESGVSTLTIARIERDNKIKVLKCVRGKSAEGIYLALINT